MVCWIFISSFQDNLLEMDVEKCRQLLPIYQPVYLSLIENLLIKVQYPPEDIYESWSAGMHVFVWHFCEYVPPPIDFGADPVGISIGSPDTFLSAQYLVWTSGWILNKFSWIYNWDITNNWSDFGDPDLIFKATAVVKRKVRSWGTSVFSENTITS